LTAYCHIGIGNSVTYVTINKKKDIFLTNKDIETISKCHLFNDINDNEINTLFESNRFNEKNYHKDAIIRFQGDEYSELMIILEGEISAEIQNPDGKKIIIETLKKSSAVATGVLFASDNTLPVTVVANSDIKLLFLPKKTIVQFCQKNEIFLMNYLQDSGNKILFLAEKIKLFKFNSINQKIACHLLTLSKKQGTDSVKLPYSREQLADLFGVARPSLSRGFSELHDQGILEAEGKIIHILDKSRIKEIIMSRD
jgi:CRP/FNR family transcriptional regulator, dissimilatory nitrate respiration regulator